MNSNLEKVTNLNNLYYELSNLNTNGCSVVDSFTGSHKTSSFINFLQSILKENTNKKIYYYITPRLSNISQTYYDLLSKIPKDKHHKILKIDSNMEHFIMMNQSEYNQLNGLMSYIAITKKEKSKIIYKKLTEFNNELFQSIKNLRKLNNSDLPNHYKYEKSKESISKIYYILQRLFEYVSYSEMNKVLNEEQMYFFDKIFFPSMLIRKNQVSVVFCSTQKALSGFSEPKGLYLPFQYSKNNVFFLDESDSQYHEMIQFLSNKQHYNLYEHLKQVLMALSVLPGLPLNELYVLKNGQSFNDYYHQFKQNTVLPFIEKYSPFLKLKYMLTDNDDSLHFLMDTNNQLFTPNTKAINYKTDLASFNNHITQDESDITLQEFISDSHKFLDSQFTDFFFVLFKNYFINYKKHYDEKHILFNNLFASLLSDFNLYSEQDMYYPNSFFSRLRENIQYHAINTNAETFYDKPFKYTSIYKDTIDGDVEIKSIFVPYSPNHIIKTMTNNNLVILSSATAKNISCVHNFDLEYLCNYLESKNLLYYHMDNNEMIMTYIKNKQNNYKKSYNNDLSVYSCDNNPNVNKWLNDWFLNNNLDDKSINLLLNAGMGKSINELYYKRLYSLLNNIYYFINNDHKYGLFYLPKLYNNSEAILLLNSIIQQTESNINIYSVNANDIKNNIFEKHIWPKFEENYEQKTIILTHYHTISSGINLQRPTHELERLFDSDYLMDVDYLYLETPTDMLQSSFTGNDKHSQSLITAIFNIQSLFFKSQLNESDYLSAMNSLVKNVNQGSLLYLNKLYKKTNDYQYAIIRLLEQSLGRMSRTFNKHHVNTIALSPLFKDLLLTFDIESIDVKKSSYEMQFLVEYLEP